MNTSRKYAPERVSKAARFTIVGVLLLAVAACSKDSGDGEVISSRPLPLGDLILNPFCEDFGLFQETCVLDDPDNPFATASVNWSDGDAKFAFYGTILTEVAALFAPGPVPAGTLEKTNVYFWATAQAKAPNGENQWQAAQAMYQLANQSCSQLIQDQAQRAYRSTLDNYFNDVTFFSTDDFPFPPPWPEVFYPFPVKILVADQLRLGVGPAAAACGGTGYIAFMFDPIGGAVGDRNDFVARVRLNDWGYLFDDVLNDLTKK